MRILVVSDTHGEIDNIKLLVDKLKNEKFDMIIHLGDDSPDAEHLKPLNAPLYVVPGVYEPHYKNPETKRRIIVELDGIRVLLSHTDTKHQNDPPEEEDPLERLKKGEVDALFHGHTHIPKISLEGRKLILNPGHLKKSDKKGYPPTYAIVEIEGELVRIDLYKLTDGTRLASLQVSKSFIKG
ncbi:MAG: YfcE family phosphodiesterase [Crenarchaeota archaeon]|jgi:putative phosphoesterase|nr:YfcE family phosphodiesterase [Thermoproteota archaeon]